MEDESDYKILSEFARIREHNFIHFIEEPFFVPIYGRDAREAKAHLFGSARRREGEKYLKENFFPAALKNPLKDSDYLIVTPASKSILPEFLEKAEIKLSRKDYFQIAAQMKPEEIHPEVLEKLDAITNVIIRP